MDSAPPEYRCYACRRSTPAAELSDGALPGLCMLCRRRSRAVRERLAGLFADRFGAAHFDHPDVDPPVPKSGRRCVCCGMSGTAFGWTRWRERATPEGADGPGIEGDAYEFCMNCESLHADPWRTSASMLTGTHSVGGGALTPLSTLPSFLLVELIGLFFISIALLALLM